LADLAGDKIGSAEIGSGLARLRDNHKAFALAATTSPKLAADATTSANVAALSTTGIEAKAALKAGKAPEMQWRARASDLLIGREKDGHASATIPQSLATSQPATDLTIPITPAVRKCTAAANLLPASGREP
jgi:hypothetical protein